jgi:hypothetical protein
MLMSETRGRPYLSHTSRTSRKLLIENGWPPSRLPQNSILTAATFSGPISLIAFSSALTSISALKGYSLLVLKASGCGNSSTLPP